MTLLRLAGALLGPATIGLIVLQGGCGSSGNGGALGEVGTYDADGGMFLGGDASATGALDAYIEERQVQVSFITLGCANKCASVEAVGTGGHPPYGYKWDDGSTNPVREVCPTSSTSFGVKVTDTGTDGEFPRPAETAQASLTADVIACPDGGAACDDGGAGGPAIAPGHYVGTVDCPPDGGVISLPSLDGGTNSGTLTLDLAFTGSSATGRLYFLWSIGGAIAVQASLEGALSCSNGDLHTTWVNGEWGLPVTGSDGGMTVTPTGTATNGTLTATTVSGSPGTIAGDFDYYTSTGSCLGTYVATLQP